jgi:CheY-like chemotaxis protein
MDYNDIVDYNFPRKTVLNTPLRKPIDDQWIKENTQLKSARRKKILLIEDDLDMAQVLAYKLVKECGCNIDFAFDPFEAIDQATENFYDFIILDWNLPDLNGGQTLLRIEKQIHLEPNAPPEWDGKRIPVIVFSSGERQECPLKESRHFDYLGFISKAQPFQRIIETFSDLFRKRELSS